MNQRTTIIVSVTALVVCIAGYALWARTHSNQAKNIVTNFYHMWTDSSIHPLVERSYRGSPYLTNEMQRKLDRLGKTYIQGGFDPIVCGTSMPDSYSISFADGDRVHPTFTVDMLWSKGMRGRATATALKQANGKWLIDSLTCDNTNVDHAAAEAYLRAHIGELSQKKAEQGAVFTVTDIRWTADNTAQVSYEDGHAALKADAVFLVENGLLQVKNFSIVEVGK